MFEEAQTMLKRMVKEKLIVARGVVGLYPARARGDDIVMLSEDCASSVGVLYGLRQQVRCALVFHNGMNRFSFCMLTTSKLY